MLTDKKKIFRHLLANTLLASVTNAFVWFSLTFWVFLQTKSVLATSLIAGTFAVMNMGGAFLFGGVVDHHKKRHAMLYSSVASLTAYSLGAALFFASPADAFLHVGSPRLWLLIGLLTLGSVAGNLRMIALSTLVSRLFAEGRDKANGMIGMVNGLSFSITSVLSGMAIGFFGMKVALVSALAGTILALLHLFSLRFEEPKEPESKKEDSPKEEPVSKKLDVRGTIRVVSSVPGLFGLIFFTTFNNFLGGVFMALMDAYGLSLVSVQAWGAMFALLSFGFILSSSYIAKYGLRPNALRAMLRINLVTWTTCIFFTIQPSVWLLGAGILIWITLGPFIEATESTVIQTVVPYERQGRVFGFAQSIESAATPITAFLIGPIAQWIFIPFMTTGAGVELIGDWLGGGLGRGIALVFMVAGTIGLTATLLAFRSRSYKILAQRYLESKRQPSPQAEAAK